MCQWLFEEEVGEEKMVCMLGFLHLEMCTQEVAGKLIGGSGWERMFVLAKTHPPGVAASLLGGHKVKRTRHAYLVTLGWLNILRNDAYSRYCKEPGHTMRWKYGKKNCTNLHLQHAIGEK